MAKWTEIDIYTGLVKNVDEDVPANFAGQGSKVALPPDAQIKKKNKQLIDEWYTDACAQAIVVQSIINKFKKSNNNNYI